MALSSFILVWEIRRRSILPYLVISEKRLELVPDVNYPPLSDRTHLTLPNGADSARNLTVAATVSLSFFKTYTNTALKKSSMNAK